MNLKKVYTSVVIASPGAATICEVMHGTHDGATKY